MADISNFTHKWRAAPANIYHNEGNKIVKRNRQPVSCAPCRNRKLKCDRGHPCDACTKRNDEEACVYGKAPTTSGSTMTTTGTNGSRRDETKTHAKAQERLKHLEDLVKQMIGPEKSIPTVQGSSTANSQQQMPEGSLNMDSNGLSYTGSTHWATVLDQIQELRHTLSPNDIKEEEDVAQSVGGRTDSLFACPQPPPLSVVLQRHLPPREECSRYLSTYFNARYLTVPFIHRNQFKRQYEQFWDNQLETSPIWTSILFSIMCMADCIRRAPHALYGPGMGGSPAGSSFLTASAQCLVLGNFVRPQPYIVEALSMHSQCKYAVSLDPSQELGMIFSILSRQAYTMGYHREPSKFENHFTVFEAEMRRRCWSLLTQFDTMVSFQIGLPAIIQPDSSDIKPPSHLLDDDFDEDATFLPPPRPDTDATQMLYLITKARIMETYRKVCQHTLTFPKRPFTAIDIADLDLGISQAIDSVPATLRARPLSDCYADPTHLTMMRSNLMFLGLKARCVLHRKYMTSGPNAEFSRSKCVDSATLIIKHFLDLNSELQPGGQLYTERWMLSSFTINDFLLALVVLSLTFSMAKKNFMASDRGQEDKWLEHDNEAKQLLILLRKAQSVCAEYGAKAREARHVAQAVGLILKGVGSKGEQANRNGNHSNKNDNNDPMAPQNGGAFTSDALSKNIIQDSQTVPVDIMPLSIHNNSNNGNTVTINPHEDTKMYDMVRSQRQPLLPGAPLPLAPLLDSPTSSSMPSYNTNNASPNTQNSTFRFPSMSESMSDPSPASSSWDTAYTTNGSSNNDANGSDADNPLTDMLLDGPEEINWAQFDQFLWMYGVASPPATGQNGGGMGMGMMSGGEDDDLRMNQQYYT